MASADLIDKGLGELIDKMRSDNKERFATSNDLEIKQLDVLKDINKSLEKNIKMEASIFSAFADLKDSFGKTSISPEQEEKGENIGEALHDVLKTISETSSSMLNVLSNILNVSLDDSRANREAAAEAARKAMGEGAAGVPDAKVEEAKAGGFFSKMGKAVMNPVKALGSGLKSIGRGIEGILTGIARGLIAFANPMVILGIANVAISLPIFAAGLAAAFKVFEMIMGKGSVLEFVTGLLESIGKVLGIIVFSVLAGLGEFVKRSGKGITAFMNGLAVIAAALGVVLVEVLKVLVDFLTNPILNKTLQVIIKGIASVINTFQGVVVAALDAISKILTKVGDVIIKVVGSVEKVVATVGSVIEKILGSFDNVVNQIEPIVKAIGASISGIIDSISAGIDKLGKSIEGIINSIGTNVTKVINSISSLIETIGKTITGVIDGIVTGIERLSTLDAGNMAKVAVGLGLLAVGLAAFSVGAAVAGGTMPSKETLEGIAKSVEKFGAIDASNLSKVGDGMRDVGVGLGAFGVGGKLAELLAPGKGTLESVSNSVAKFGEIDATNFAKVGTGIAAIGVGLMKFGGGGFLSGLAEGFGKLIGKSDPVEKFQRFATMGPGLLVAAAGITGLARAMNVLGNSNIKGTAEALDDFMDELDMDKLKAFSKATEGLMTGKMLAELQVESNNLAATPTSVVVQDNSQSTVTSSQPLILPTPAIAPGNSGTVMDVRIVG